MSFLKKLASKKTAPLILAVFFALLALWAQVVRIVTSGLFDGSGNLIFFGPVLFHDSNVHLSLIAEILHRFPPTNFSYFFEGEQILKNYHYIYDILLALTHRIFLISSLDLYYRIFPILISISLSTVIFLTAYRLTKSKIVAAFSIFFTIFATSLGSTLPHIKTIFGGNHVTGGSNIFMTDQMLDILVNPHGALSLVLYLTLFLLLSSYETFKKKISLVLFALFLGLSFGLKAYGGVIFSAASLIVIMLALKRRDKFVFLSVVAGLTLVAAWIYFTINGSVAGMKFAPFWTVEKMVMDLDRLNEPHFYLLLTYYQAASNYLRIALWYLFFTAIYLIGSMGLRVIGVWEFVPRSKSIKKISFSEAFLWASAFVSLVIPVLFNQTKKAYDVVQFTTYFTLFSGILFSITVFKIIGKIRNKPLKVLTLSLIIFVTLLMNSTELKSRIYEFQNPNEKIIINKEVLDAASYIKSNTPDNAIFLLAPSEMNLRFSWFPSLFERRTVYSGRGFAFQVGVDTQKTELRLSNVFTGQERFENFDYLFLTSTEERQFARIKEMYNLSEVYRNSEASVFKKEEAK